MSGDLEVPVRPLRASDIRELSEVLGRAYGASDPAQFRARLEAYLVTAHAQTFVAEYNGRAAGMVVGNDYDVSGYVSLMGVDPALQRRGIATALMDALTIWANDHDFACLELDATSMGAPLYTRYGFRDDGETHVYTIERREPLASASLPRRYLPSDRDALIALDRAAFGADRRSVLGQLLDDDTNEVFVDDAHGAVCGFGMAQHRAEQIGPVVALDASAGTRLLRAAHQALPAQHRACVPSGNSEAVEILTAWGFRYARSLRHMVRGTPLKAARERIYARTNLGQG